MAETYETLNLVKDGSVLIVTINNTRSKVNLFRQQTAVELNILITSLQNDTSTKVVIFKSGEPDPTAIDAAAFNGRVFQAMSNLPQPVIAMIDGPARGAGNEFLVACDMRFASKGARFSNFEGTLGLHPGSGGAAWMPLHIGRGRAMEFLLSGEDIDAETAERYGYVNKAFETSEEMHEYVMKLAKRIALFPLNGLASIKKTVTTLIQPSAELMASEAVEWNRLLAEPEQAGLVGEFIKRSENLTSVDFELHVPDEVVKLYGK
ncbi:hypothetical protein A0O28_0006270 [Trichoderma guizhouense]|uniref:Enoyl-CoA hydratase/isomerase n=1 Tax=Trichoderma guizhouense TaxID=1491466 RepID=A0A1T3CHI6_9HYPO|nr:hypothetical protein A0O28_0006270 [Trichoderma guizhouense]